MRSSLSLLQTKETQLPQPLIVRDVLHSLNHLCGSALDSLKQFPVLELRGPELNTILQVWSRHSRVEGEENLSGPTNHIPSNTPQNAIGLLGHRAQ